MKGENALGWNVPNRDSWRRMRAALRHPDGGGGPYAGLTILRMRDVTHSVIAAWEFSRIARDFDAQLPPGRTTRPAHVYW